MHLRGSFLDLAPPCSKAVRNSERLNQQQLPAEVNERENSQKCCNLKILLNRTGTVASGTAAAGLQFAASQRKRTYRGCASHWRRHAYSGFHIGDARLSVDVGIKISR